MGKASSERWLSRQQSETFHVVDIRDDGIPHAGNGNDGSISLSDKIKIRILRIPLIQKLRWRLAKRDFWILLEGQWPARFYRGWIKRHTVHDFRGALDRARENTEPIRQALADERMRIQNGVQRQRHPTREFLDLIERERK